MYVSIFLTLTIEPKSEKHRVLESETCYNPAVFLPSLETGLETDLSNLTFFIGKMRPLLLTLIELRELPEMMHTKCSATASGV